MKSFKIFLLCLLSAIAFSCASIPKITDYVELVPVSEIPAEDKLSDGEEPEELSTFKSYQLAEFQDARKGYPVYVPEKGAFYRIVAYYRVKYPATAYLTVASAKKWTKATADFHKSMCKEKGLKYYGGVYSEDHFHVGNGLYVECKMDEVADKYKLGLDVVDVFNRNLKQKNGVYVTCVYENLSADNASNTLVKGDVITKLNGISVNSYGVFISEQQKLPYNSPITITFVRGATKEFGGYEQTTELVTYNPAE